MSSHSLRAAARHAALATVCTAALALAGAALMPSTAAWASTAQKAPKSTGKKKPSKVSFIDAPSGENEATRTKRLKLECQGRPNAGVCLGHTR